MNDIESNPWDRISSYMQEGLTIIEAIERQMREHLNMTHEEFCRLQHEHCLYSEWVNEETLVPYDDRLRGVPKGKFGVGGTMTCFSLVFVDHITRDLQNFSLRRQCVVCAHKREHCEFLPLLFMRSYIRYDSLVTLHELTHLFGEIIDENKTYPNDKMIVARMNGVRCEYFSGTFPKQKRPKRRDRRKRKGSPYRSRKKA